MKTVTVKTFTTAAILAFILVAFPASVFAAGQEIVSGQDNASHMTLAQHYKQQAEEYKARIENEIEAVRNKPRSAFFGKNVRNFKRHVAFKLHNFEVAVAENLGKAAYHEKMAAEQTGQPVSVTASNAENGDG